MGKFNVIAAICGLGLGFVVAAPAAQASTFNLIDPQEGEVKLTNFEDGSMQAIDSSSLVDLGFSVTSLDYTDNSYDTGLSRLFVDKKGSYNEYDTGEGLIKFGIRDDGTNEPVGEYWLRAVARNADGTLIEEGQLEVGLFKFDFGEVVDEISLDFFDTETSGVTGITHINGESVENYLLNAGADGNFQTTTLTDVKSFTLKLGEKFDDNAQWPGDGVTLAGLKSSKDFAVAKVPEPTTTISLGALAVAGMFGVKKRKKLNK